MPEQTSVPVKNSDARPPRRVFPLFDELQQAMERRWSRDWAFGPWLLSRSPWPGAALSDARPPRRVFPLFDELQQAMERRWSRDWAFGPWLLSRSPWPGAAQPAIWAPRMDVFEKEGAVMVKADLPGVSKEDVHVELDGDDLVIRGERKGESEVKEGDHHRMERTYGSFHRRLRLRFQPSPNTISATFKDGVLEMRIPWPAEAKAEAKTITVS